MSAPWFVRNAAVYGNLDVFGWQRHNAIVEGQLRTVDLLARIGPASFAKAFVVTTFRSFWAQFGWMGVLIDQRLYHALALVSALLGLGFVTFIGRAQKGKASLSQAQRRSLVILGTCALFVLMQHLWYNTQFVQHQGRYLFPALGAIALAAALGLREALQPRTARLLVRVLLTGTVLLVAYGALSNHVATWGLALLVAGAAFLACSGWLTTMRQWLAPAVLYASFLTLDLICLFVYIVPYLR